MTDSRPSHPAIVTTALTKQYTEALALHEVSLKVETGSIFGFLGPNGAGKTTTIKLLLGFTSPTSGKAEIFGHETWRDGVEARRHIGFLVQADAFYPDMSGRSQLELAARLSGRSPALQGQLLDLLELANRDLDRKVVQYSKGMKQKLALVAAAQHDPPLLILDEPTEGLDPLIQRRFEQFLRECNGRGRTIFMSSHDLAEVERLCQEVAIVREGQLVVTESIERIRQMRVRQVDVTFAGAAPEDLSWLDGVQVLAVAGRRWTLAIEDAIDPLIKVLATSDVEDLTVVPPSLDDVFMTYYDPKAPVEHTSDGSRVETLGGAR